MAASVKLSSIGATNELTRETVGIRLALVRELATAMPGRADVRFVDRGVEVVVELPVRVA